MDAARLFRTAVAALCVAMAPAFALAGAKPPDRLGGLTEVEKALADTVDHWGLPFGDQLTRFQAHFAASPKATFAVGVTHDLVKVLPNKFWFRGEVFLPGAEGATARELIACAGETVSFQFAVLSALGTKGGAFTVGVRCRVASGSEPKATVFREVFLKTPVPPYPRFASDRWPDPLVECREVRAKTIEPAVCWVDIAIPADAAAGALVCEVEVASKVTEERVALAVPVRVVRGITLDPKGYPLVAWFGRKSGPITLSDEQFTGMCKLALTHHCQPMRVCRWDPKQPEQFDKMVELLFANGQRVIQVDSPPGPGAKPAAVERFAALYSRLKERGWLARSLAYSNADEPDAETFRTRNVPYMEHVRKTYPGLRVFLASELHEGIGRACDIVLTDLSSVKYDPRTYVPKAAPELWHYYCHLPVRWQARAPLVHAPNMQIDNPALQHRLAMWMSYRFGAHGVFIWAGNREWDKMATIWQDATVRVPRPYKFPYGGTHNGNGNLVYPPPTKDGPVVPSIRLKVLRDGVEDVALLRACKALVAGEGGAKLSAEMRARLAKLVEPVPGVFHHPHYYDRLPDTLLGRREAILRLLAEAKRP